MEDAKVVVDRGTIVASSDIPSQSDHTFHTHSMLSILYGELCHTAHTAVEAASAAALVVMASVSSMLAVPQVV